jgi:Domain of unknown function (DUF5659)
MDTDETFRTNDMGMATFLRAEGHEVIEVLWESGTCYWRFAISGNLVQLVEDFQADRARVNPKQFTRNFSKTKHEMYTSRPQ